jgi:uncharacterized repeat protein (TIGR01451 family)
MYAKIHVYLLCMVLSAFVSARPVLAAGLTANTRIFNQAQLFYFDGAHTQSLTASAAVTAVVRTPSRLEFLTYAPLMTAADQVTVPATTYRAGSSITDPFISVPLPIPVGSTTPINLNRPINLTPSPQFHQGEPLFIRLVDTDQNLDSTRAETVVITITNRANGDTEVVRLTESGPASGVFVGYLATSGSQQISCNGSMSVSAGDILTARYVDEMDTSDSSAASILVDPHGLLFDSVSGQPVSGAAITLVNSTTGLPAEVFGDDGVSSFPATVTSGGTHRDSSGRVYAFAPGGYRFPYVRPGQYRYRITPPSGYSYPSSVATAVLARLAGGPFAIASGSRGEIFAITSGPALRIDIPLDPAPSSLWLQKSAGKDSAGYGDFVPYRLTLTNLSVATAVNVVQITDILPIGFRLRSGSITINAVPIGDPAVSSDGRTVTFTISALPPASVTTIEYVVEVTAGTRFGTATNSAIARSPEAATSNRASAAVTIRDDFMQTRSTLMGRVR